LKAGANPNSASSEGQTALMVVARTGNLENAKELLRAGADVNARESWGGQTALMWAAAAQQPAMLSLLLKHGARPDLLSTTRDWPRKVTAEPREKSMDRGGFAALHYAAREGCVACIAALVKGGADIDIADAQGTTALIMALMNLNFDTAKALIDQGADINAWDFVGQTPLYAAVDTHLVPTGARADVASTDKTTAMDIIQTLIARGANVNVQLKLRLPGRSMPGDRNGDFRVLTTGATPLMRAAVGCDVAAMEVLIKAGALIDLPIADGTTPLFATVIQAAPRARNKTEEQALAAMRMLKAAGADPRKAVGQSSRVLHIIHLHTPDHARVPGSTALMMAAVRDWKQVARQLVEWGVDIDAADADGMTALDYAMGRERYGFLQPKPMPNMEMASWLRKLGAKVENTNAPAWPPLNVPQIRAIVPELLYF
ncbi:MAG TPA: ankyrin repeat domain-containing protein, partial [Steroidobacteraceae bacterium]|nr:ankyrin repeat domain-containing protein [Steroidobacteraceae bacterium]